MNLSRRELLKQSGCGFASLAFAGLATAESAQSGFTSSLAARLPMFAARAKRVIFVFMGGGPSHMDTFEYKPALFQSDGKEYDFTGVRFGTFGKESKRKLMKPMWGFNQYGESGRWVSDLFPHIAQHVDDLCFLHGMHTEGVAHGPATLFLHTGATNLVRPSIGSWITYGLGTENQNLPGFVSIGPSATKGGPRNYGNAFLPAIYQGSPLGQATRPETQKNFKHLTSAASLDDRLRQQKFLRELNELQLDRLAGDDRLEAVISSYELTARMQEKAPQVLDTSGETADTLATYGLDNPKTRDFGHQCLLARRFAESGVRYIQVNYTDESPNPPWDQHDNMPKHADHALATDKPVAGLLSDLKQRGLLDDTLVWWGAEFGRTAFTQNKNGRDHNPRGFTSFLAGGGTKQGFAYGATDEIGEIAVEGKVHMHDLHATVLHCLGLDHEQLTYRYAGRDFRLTDVAGRIVKEILV